MVWWSLNFKPAKDYIELAKSLLLTLNLGLKNEFKSLTKLLNKLLIKKFLPNISGNPGSLSYKIDYALYKFYNVYETKLSSKPNLFLYLKYRLISSIPIC